VKLIGNSGTKNKEYLKTKMKDLKLTVRTRISDLYRGIIDFKQGYQPGSNEVKNEKNDLVTESHRILARWRNHFFQLITQPSSSVILHDLISGNLGVLSSKLGINNCTS
jgi:hypothetical protein